MSFLRHQYINEINACLSVRKKQIIILLISVFLIELIRTAWIGDDAAITLRTVLNFINGYGPTFNVGERVQAYTHPLWFLLISLLSVFTGNVFVATFIASIATSLLVVYIFIAKVALSNNAILTTIVAVALLLSKAFVDYSTSGLENPLTHLLLLLLLLESRQLINNSQKQTTTFFFLCSLIYLTRMDIGVLLLPLMVWVLLRYRHTPKKLCQALLIGSVPAILWTLFSLFYYGFPFPNTAYAKLGTDIPTDEKALQGFTYLLHTIGRDAVSIFLMVFGIFFGWFSRGVYRMLSLGIVCYVLYVVFIGGDFMEGRFFSCTTVVAAAIIVSSSLSYLQIFAFSVLVMSFGFANIGATLLSDKTYKGKIFANGISDERGGAFNEGRSLLDFSQQDFAIRDWKSDKTSVAVVCGRLGYTGMENGPGLHLIDSCALADPLLSKLPAKENPSWRIGHFYRQLPTDYKLSVEKNENLLHDPESKAYYDVIRTITRGDLVSSARFWAILKINLGITALSNRSMYRYDYIPPRSTAETIDYEALSTIVETGNMWNKPGNILFNEVVYISFDKPLSFSFIDLSVDNNDIYRIDILNNGDWQQLVEFGPKPADGMRRYHLSLASPTPLVDKVRLVAVSGDGGYSLGHFIVE